MIHVLNDDFFCFLQNGIYFVHKLQATMLLFSGFYFKILLLFLGMVFGYGIWAGTSILVIL